MTPLERAARAVADYSQRRLPPSDSAATCEGIARAVLQAIREPSEGMIEAGFGVHDLDDNPGDDLAEASNRRNVGIVWRAMIGEALSEDEFIAVKREVME